MCEKNMTIFMFKVVDYMPFERFRLTHPSVFLNKKPGIFKSAPYQKVFYRLYSCLVVQIIYGDIKLRRIKYTRIFCKKIFVQVINRRFFPIFTRIKMKYKFFGDIKL